jgi:hypothetical protein
LVAEADDEIIGFAMANPSKNELLAVYIKPNSIGNVGHALLTEVENRAFRVGEFLTCDASLNAEGFYSSRRDGGECFNGRKRSCSRATTTVCPSAPNSSDKRPAEYGFIQL